MLGTCIFKKHHTFYNKMMVYRCVRSNHYSTSQL